MKYLDEPRLAYWSNFLRSVELGDRLLSVRTDAFSCELEIREIIQYSRWFSQQVGRLSNNNWAHV